MSGVSVHEENSLRPCDQLASAGKSNRCLDDILLAAPIAMAAEESVEEADTVVVYGTELSRYEFDEAESATGFNADVDELPGSIQVLPGQLILD